MKTLKLFSTSLAALCALFLAGTAQAQSADGYPNKPIRVIVPFPVGGTADILPRQASFAMIRRANEVED